MLTAYLLANLILAFAVCNTVITVVFYCYECLLSMPYSSVSIGVTKKLDVLLSCKVFRIVNCFLVKYFSAFSALTLLVGHQEEHPACKKLSDVVLGVVICLEQGADCLHMVQLMPLPSQNPIISCLIWIQTGFTFLVPAYAGCPGEEAIKWVY